MDILFYMTHSVLFNMPVFICIGILLFSPGK